MAKVKENLVSKCKELLGSRKFYLTVGSIALVVCNDIFELNIPAETVYTIAGSIASLVIGLAVIDAKK